MKFSYLLVILAIVAFIAPVLATEADIEANREVRSYVNELEYADHVDANPGLSSESESTSETEDESSSDHAMMETESGDADSADEQHYSMMSDSEAEAEQQAEEEFGVTQQSFLEADAAQDIDTDVVRAMALEIHDHAQNLIDADDQVLLQVDSEVEAETETEAETEVDSELDLEAETESESEMDAFAEAEAEAELEGQVDVDAEGEMFADPPLLSPAELALEKADKAAEAADAAAEKKDNAEAAVDTKAAAADTKAAAVAATVAAAAAAAPTPAPAAPAAAPAAAPTPAAAAPAPAAAAPAPAAAPAATPAPAEPAKTVVTLPADLSAEHAETLRANAEATATIQSALGEVSGILASKDDTIKSLVANITYLTVNIGKLANKVDLQRSYIGLLSEKLRVAQLKNKRLNAHVKHSVDTVSDVRQQLKAIKARLTSQDQKTEKLVDFLGQHKDTTELPALKDDLVIRGPRTTVPKHNAKLARRVRAKINKRLRPVDGTQVYASADYTRIPIPAPHWFPSSFFHPTGPTPLTHPTYPFGADGIPTIVVERRDDGN